MKRVRAAAIVALLLLTGGIVMACEESLDGRVSVVGNEPFAYLALTTEEGRQVALAGEKAEELGAEYQGRWVRVYGSIEQEERGPGRPARFSVERFEAIEPPR